MIKNTVWENIFTPMVQFTKDNSKMAKSTVEEHSSFPINQYTRAILKMDSSAEKANTIFMMVKAMKENGKKT